MAALRIYDRFRKKMSKAITYNLVGRKLGESSLFLRISLHLFTESNNKNVSPTLNKVAKFFAINLRAIGPGELLT